MQAAHAKPAPGRPDITVGGLAGRAWCLGYHQHVLTRPSSDPMDSGLRQCEKTMIALPEAR
ncbi:hypothetical protein FDG2_5380 [Candidatus Protofrankia californiensis]|uniref:Uncharacterized protein n=1 Tax=Candidatus Protofrankia californiensis TaxID=1839754 RepID=A0A1C3PCV3_9ACTN|nr:hypothetical protein FDG2_5380 [Candidatus Protofrankia californiensis]